MTLLQVAQRVLHARLDDGLPFCRECQKPVEMAMWDDKGEELLFRVWCHQEYRSATVAKRRLEVSRSAANYAGVIDELEKAIKGPWYWPLPPPGPEVP